MDRGVRWRKVRVLGRSAARIGAWTGVAWGALLLGELLWAAGGAPVGRHLALAALVLVLGLAPLAAGLRGPPLLRLSVLAIFVSVSWGLGAISRTGAPAAAALSSLLAAAALVPLGDRSAVSLGSWLGAHPPFVWGLRVGAAVVLVPVFYIGFDWFTGIVLGLAGRPDGFDPVQPPWAQILPTLVAQSAVLVVVTLPVIAIWGRDHLWFVGALALSLFAAALAFDLAGGGPVGIRLPHGVALVADALAFAVTLVLLVGVPTEAEPPLVASRGLAHDAPRGEP